MKSCWGAARSCRELRGTAESSIELPEAAKSCQQLLRAVWSWQACAAHANTKQDGDTKASLLDPQFGRKRIRKIRVLPDDGPRACPNVVFHSLFVNSQSECMNDREAAQQKHFSSPHGRHHARHHQIHRQCINMHACLAACSVMLQWIRQS